LATGWWAGTGRPAWRNRAAAAGLLREDPVLLEKIRRLLD
jgi:hypothetical protein